MNKVMLQPVADWHGTKPQTVKYESGFIYFSQQISSKKNNDYFISKSALLWDITQRVVVITYRRFRTNYLVPPSKVKRSKKNAGNTACHSNFTIYSGNKDTGTLPAFFLDFITFEDGTR
jgi:hypothetical protein